MPRGFSDKLAKKRAEILKRLQSGESPQSICNDLGCSPNHVAKIAGNNGLRLSTRYVTAEEFVEITGLLLGKDSITEIAKKTNRGRDLIVSISKGLRALGLPINHRPMGRPKK